MKVSRLKYIAMGAILGLSFVSCEDFWTDPMKIVTTMATISKMMPRPKLVSIHFTIHRGTTF